MGHGDRTAARHEEVDMLFFAEGHFRQLMEPDERAVAAAWLGPMVDSGFLQAGYLDSGNQRVVMILSAPSRAEIDQRLSDLPVVRQRKVDFSVSQVSALRFT
jgi:hypothetical protein